MKPTMQMRWAVLSVPDQEAPRRLQQFWTYDIEDCQPKDGPPGIWIDVPMYFTREWPPK